MRKKFIFILFIILITLFTTGCFEGDELEGSNITTTIYPIEFLISRLYGNSELKSIYPNDTNINEYSLTDKQYSDYAKNTTIFIYNGLTEEKEIAKNLINKNKRIQILDVTYGLKYRYGIEELWLSPNNFIMLAETVKNNLKELSTSKYAAEDIEKNYSLLEEDLSSLDADLRNLAKAAINKGKSTIVIAYDAFGFLENYGFNVINISSETNITTSIKNGFKNKTYTHIFVKDKDNVSDSVKDIVDNYGATLVEINTMDTLTDQERANNDNYITITRDFMNTLSNILLG